MPGNLTGDLIISFDVYASLTPRFPLIKVEDAQAYVPQSAIFYFHGFKVLEDHTPDSLVLSYTKCKEDMVAFSVMAGFSMVNYGLDDGVLQFTESGKFFVENCDFEGKPVKNPGPENLQISLCNITTADKSYAMLNIETDAVAVSLAPHQHKE